MNLIKRHDYNELTEELSEIIETMDIPLKRREDYRWLKRNLPFNNGHEPKCSRAMEILDILLAGEEL